MGFHVQQEKSAKSSTRQARGCSVLVADPSYASTSRAVAIPNLSSTFSEQNDIQSSIRSQNFTDDRHTFSSPVNIQLPSTSGVINSNSASSSNYSNCPQIVPTPGDINDAVPSTNISFGAHIPASGVIAECNSVNPMLTTQSRTDSCKGQEHNVQSNIKISAKQKKIANYLLKELHLKGLKNILKTVRKNPLTFDAVFAKTSSTLKELKKRDQEEGTERFNTFFFDYFFELAHAFGADVVDSDLYNKDNNHLEHIEELKRLWKFELLAIAICIVNLKKPKLLIKFCPFKGENFGITELAPIHAAAIFNYKEPLVARCVADILVAVGFNPDMPLRYSDGSKTSLLYELYQSENLYKGVINELEKMKTENLSPVFTKFTNNSQIQEQLGSEQTEPCGNALMANSGQVATPGHFITDQPIYVYDKKDPEAFEHTVEIEGGDLIGEKGKGCDQKASTNKY